MCVCTVISLPPQSFPKIRNQKKRAREKKAGNSPEERIERMVFLNDNSNEQKSGREREREGYYNARGAVETGRKKAAVQDEAKGGGGGISM